MPDLVWSEENGDSRPFIINLWTPTLPAMSLFSYQHLHQSSQPIQLWILCRQTHNAISAVQLLSLDGNKILDK